MIVIIDLDDLKSVNDGTSSHSAGGHSFAPPPTSSAAPIADQHFPARLGGDEFGVILTATNASRAQEIARRLGLAWPTRRCLHPWDDHPVTRTALLATTSTGPIRQCAPLNGLDTEVLPRSNEPDTQV